MTQTSIINLTIDKVESILEEYFVTNADPDQPELVPATIRAGRLQADPTAGTGISFLIHPNHYADEEYVHELAEAKYGYHPATHEIGYGRQYWRAYTVEVLFFDMGESDRAVSRQSAQVLLSKLEHSLVVGGVERSGQDTFGESVIEPAVIVSSLIRESGGSGAFIWRGEVRFKTLNQKEF